MSLRVAEAKRVGRPAWANARTLGGAVLFLVAFAGGHHVLDAPVPTTAVWMATRDLAAHSVIGSADIELVRLETTSDMLRSYATGGTDLEGAFVTRPIALGEMVPMSSLSAASAGAAGRVMSIPVALEHAAGGLLSSGDLVDVYATFGRDGSARTVLIAARAEVVGLVDGSSLSMMDPTMAGVSLSVSPETAAKLAFAIRNGELDLVKVTGSQPGYPRIQLEDL